MVNHLSGSLELAVNAVKNAAESVRSAARRYGVPRETLRRHVKGENASCKRGPKTHLNEDQEKELREALIHLEDIGVGLSHSELRILAEEICIKANSAPFKNGQPTRKWVRGFLKRHNLSFRQPQNISVNRTNMETLEIKTEFYSKLKSVLDSLTARGLQPSSIYNTDETGLCIVSKSGRVIALKGKKRVVVQKSGERGQNISVLATVNATGSVILPPTIIFRGKTLNEDLMVGAPEGAVFASSPRSFIDSELFVEWFQRFIKAIPPARPVLLLLDGHASHITLEVIHLANENDIHILCFPPHTTHLYQPLDHSVFGPLKKGVSAEETKLMRKNKLSKLSRQHFSQILKPAWLKAVSPANIVGGFRGCGIWPFDPSQVVLPCERSSLQAAVRDDSDTTTAVIRPPEEQPVELGTASASAIVRVPEEQPGELHNPSQGEEREEGRLDGETPRIRKLTSPDPSYGTIATSPTALPSITSFPVVTTSPVVAALAHFLKPIENATPTSSKISKKITKTRMITSPEFRKEMEDKENARKEKERAKLEKQEARRKRIEEKREKVKKTKKRKQSSQTRNEESECTASEVDSGSEKENANRGPTRKKKAKPKKASQRKKRKNESESESDDSVEADEPDSCSDSSEEEEEFCGTCGKSFQKDHKGEPWIRCSLCQDWYHMECQNLRSEEFTLTFKCDECVPLSVQAQSEKAK